MRRYLTLRILLLWVVVWGGVGVSASADSTVESSAQRYFIFVPMVMQPETPPQQVEVVTFIMRAVERTNHYRAEAGCAPLRVDLRLNEAALRHSKDMAQNGFFGHFGSDGSGLSQRVREAGYDWTRVAENIAGAYDGPEAVVDAWFDSPAHRSNMLDCYMTDVGIGYYFVPNDTGQVTFRHYWTQVLATDTWDWWHAENP